MSNIIDFLARDCVTLDEMEKIMRARGVAADVIEDVMRHAKAISAAFSIPNGPISYRLPPDLTPEQASAITSAVHRAFDGYRQSVQDAKLGGIMVIARERLAVHLPKN